ncbi:hypothetical protein DLJ74_14405 [Gracilibacillus dipsosauri]|uniref:Uncharacterized protein n=1 Tax=Gracilibacillus dipsosauri TaxID=178340 RepID=A0A317KW45_9BACI|nr:hypothetical protein DLJ74_14405 [Gracilibacillus dipsosauri]
MFKKFMRKISHEMKKYGSSSKRHRYQRYSSSKRKHRYYGSSSGRRHHHPYSGSHRYKRRGFFGSSSS